MMMKKIVFSFKLFVITLILNAQVNSQLSESEKIFGLSQIWKEASYNYAHFDDLNKFNWDSLYLAAIEEVKNTESLVEYYSCLVKFISLLEDGHTRIIPPKEYTNHFDEPAIKIMNIEDKAIVTEVGENLSGLIPVGSEIIKVNQLKTEDYIAKFKYSFIPSSTKEFKRKIAMLELLKTKKGNEIEVQLKTPGGKMETHTLVCESKAPWYKANRNNNDILEFKWLDKNIAYVSLNTFGSNKIVNEFKKLLPEITKSKGLVIDLRKNGGGEADLGYEILRYLTNSTLVSYSWKTREHIAKYKAQGKWASYISTDKLTDEKRKLLKYYSGNAWFECSADTIFPAKEEKAIVPTAILISSFTASAAEDFLVPLQSVDRFILVGEKTAGFTGTPYIFDLPGGGIAMINTSREMYQNGKLIRNGTQPDFEVKPTIDDIINYRDVVLEKGISVLRERIE